MQMIARRRMPMTVRHRAGMGDWGTAITQAIAEDELWMLMKGVRQLSDKIIAAINGRAKVIDGYRRAKKIYYESIPIAGFPSVPTPFGMRPNPLMLPAARALKAAEKGVALYAREIQTLGMTDRVFGEISAVLTRAGLSSDANAIDQTLRQLRRFVIETDNLLTPLAPIYYKTKQKILRAAETEWDNARVPRNAVGNPAWLTLYIKAADKTVPLPSRPAVPKEVAQAGLATGMGNPLPLLIVTLIWVISIISGAIILNATLARITGDQTLQAEKAAEILKEGERTARAVELRMRREGRPDSEIRIRTAEIRGEARKNAAAVPEAVSPFGTAALALGVAGAAAVVTKILGIW